MSAWMEIVNARGDDEWLVKCSEALEEVQRETLRKAAERIRNENPDRSSDWSDGVDWSADLIDPEVES